jgi:hypothetical protein
MGKAPNEAKGLCPAPNEAIGRMGKAPNEAIAKLGKAPNEASGKVGNSPNEANGPRAERSRFPLRQTKPFSSCQTNPTFALRLRLETLTLVKDSNQGSPDHG